MVMLYFDDEGNKNINQMWINVRCFNLSMLSTTQWTVIVLIALAAVLLVLGVKYGDDVFRRKAPKGYEKDDHKN